MVAQRAPIDLTLYRALLDKKPDWMGSFAWLRECACACGHPLMFHRLRSGDGSCFAVDASKAIASARCRCVRAEVRL